jgi:hypothetical protein
VSFREFILEEDFNTVFNWWYKSNGRVLDPTILSDVGIVYMEKEQPVACAWLYIGNSQMAMIGFAVADPESGPKLKIRAIKELISHLEGHAYSLGFKYVVMNSDQSALTKVMERRGYEKMLPHATLTRKIGGSIEPSQLHLEEVYC